MVTIWGQLGGVDTLCACTQLWTHYSHETQEKQKKGKDAQPWSRDVSGYFVAHQMWHSEDVTFPSEAPRDRWNAIECAREAGGRSPQFKSAAGRPIRFHIGCVGGDRFLGLCLAPAPRDLRRKVNLPIVNAEGASMGKVNARCSGLKKLPQHAEPLSAGWDVNVFSSRSSAPVRTEGLIPLDIMGERCVRVARV